MQIDEIIEIVREAGNILLTAKRPKVMEKSGHANFVTETDEKVQRFLVEKLKAVLPEAEFLGEEDGQDVFSAKMASGYCFVIDPIDGTSNFIYAYRPSVVSVGLLKDGKPYMAVVYNPYDDMMFSAAAALIAKEAGCSVTDIEGNPLSYTGASSALCMGRGVKEIPDCFKE